jgi:acyl-CoA synthetase (AMP-forming)/AMP-acid ligase II
LIGLGQAQDLIVFFACGSECDVRTLTFADGSRIVMPMSLDMAGPELAEELIAFCQSRLAKYKCPRSIDFRPELPRRPTGKLYKRLLRDEYAAKATR